MDLVTGTKVVIHRGNISKCGKIEITRNNDNTIIYIYIVKLSSYGNSSSGLNLYAISYLIWLVEYQIKNLLSW